MAAALRPGQRTNAAVTFPTASVEHSSPTVAKAQIGDGELLLLLLRQSSRHLKMDNGKGEVQP
jgi:hypothetical protein